MRTEKQCKERVFAIWSTRSAKVLLSRLAVFPDLECGGGHTMYDIVDGSCANVPEASCSSAWRNCYCVGSTSADDDSSTASTIFSISCKLQVCNRDCALGRANAGYNDMMGEYSISVIAGLFSMGRYAERAAGFSSGICGCFLSGCTD